MIADRRRLQLRLSEAVHRRDQLEHQLDLLRAELRSVLKTHGNGSPEVAELTARIREIEPRWSEANEGVRSAKHSIWESEHAPSHGT
jgi:chromosome segregation ATPase